MVRDKAYRPFWQERFGIAKKPPSCWHNTSYRIWIHAVSLGETRAVTSLTQALAQQYPDALFLMTHSTPNGRLCSEQQLRPLLGDRLIVRYFPYDLPFIMDHFIRTWNPSLCLLVETELWPHQLFSAKRQHLPTFLISARLSRRSARHYAKLGLLTNTILNQLSGLWTQDNTSLRRFKALGYKGPSRILGNLKFDPILPSSEQLQLGEQLANAWIGSPLRIILASSRPDEEDAFINALPFPLPLTSHTTLNTSFLAITIVPRHIERCEEIILLAQKRGWNVQRKSHWNGAPLDPTNTLLLGDTMGELVAYYRGNNVAFLGGSFGPYGAQNPLEAFAAHCLLVVGPSRFNFQSILNTARKQKAIIAVNSMEEAVNAILSTPYNSIEFEAIRQAGNRFFTSQQGILQGYLTAISNVISERSKLNLITHFV